MSRTTSPVVIGGAAVGKTALVIQFIKSQFITEYYPTVEETYKKQVVVDQEATVLDVHECGGQEEYSATREQYMMSGEGFLCVFDLTNTESFNLIGTLMEEILNVKGFIVPMVLVGNKCDLRGRQVSPQQAMDLAEKFGCQYVETSASLKQNVDEAFFAIVRSIRRKRGGSSRSTSPTEPVPSPRPQSTYSLKSHSSKDLAHKKKPQCLMM